MDPKVIVFTRNEFEEADMVEKRLRRIINGLQETARLLAADAEKSKAAFTEFAIAWNRLARDAGNNCKK